MAGAGRHGPDPEAVVNLLKIAGPGGTARLVFTDRSASPVAALAEHPVYLPFEILSFGDSLAAPMSLLATLVAEIVRRQPPRVAENLQSFERMASRYGLFHRE
jgi:DNA-binding MurR/RpiR family transcriptional regulator